MGYFAHHAVLVFDPTGSDLLANRVEGLRRALELGWSQTIIGPVGTMANGGHTYAMLPDGSKEGWETSDEGDAIRERFIALCKDYDAEVAVVRFGGDEPELSMIEMVSND